MARRRIEPASPLFLAGWLFADLLLALAVILLGTMAAPPTASESQPRSTPSATPTPTPSPSPTTSTPVGIDPNPFVVEIEVNTAALLARQPAERARVGREIRELTQPSNGRRAGLVLLWGYNPNLSTGIQLAERTKPIMLTYRPVMFTGTATKELGNVGGSNKVKLEIYYYK